MSKSEQITSMVSRRGVLQWSMALSAGAVLSACGGGDDAGPPPTEVAPPSGAEPASPTPAQQVPEPAPEVVGTPDTLMEPQVLASVNGVLEVHIYVKYASFNMDLPEPEARMQAWETFPAQRTGTAVELRTLNGQYMAPTLHLHPGDTLKMWVHNELPESPKESKWAELNYQNHTNMHFHGLHVDPREVRPGVFGDYVVDSSHAGIAPGETRYHEIVLPSNHLCGAFWYHPHLHGATNAQVSSGMFGAIVIKEASDPFRASVPMRERVLFAHKMAVSSKGRIDTLEDTLRNRPSAFLLNGVYQPTIVMRPGEVQHWHVLNPSSFYPIYPMLEGHDLHFYARDGAHFGGKYHVMNRAAADAQLDMRQWPGCRIYPGGRMSLVVQASMEPGEYLLKSAKCPSWHQPDGVDDFEEVVARVVVEGEPVNNSAIPDAQLLRRSVDFAPILDDEFASKGGMSRSVHVAILFRTDSRLGIRPANEEWEHADLGGVVFVVGADNMQGFAPYHSALTLTQTMTLDTVEEWTIWNHNGYPHPFHIHVNHCYVVKVNETPVEPFWADTLPLPPGSNTAPGSITFRSRLEDFQGKFVWHCHALGHEDLGMMQVVEIVP